MHAWSHPHTYTPHDSTQQDIPNAITALSKLSYIPPEPFLRRLVSRARVKLTQFNSQALCNFIFGLCKLAFDPVRFVGPAAPIYTHQTIHPTQLPTYPT